ncbi:MAG TPA: flagellar basal body-associated FliL family protein [Planctomycetaceae bacterium]
MKGKIKFILPLVALVLLGGAYKTVLAKPTPAPKPKVEGQVYVLPKEFLVNLAEDRYAKLTVALVLPHDEPVAAAEGHGATPPEGWGTLPQEAVIRGLVTDTLTGTKAERLISPEGRERIKDRLLKKIHKYSDVHAEEVLLTDVAVQ